MRPAVGPAGVGTGRVDLQRIYDGRHAWSAFLGCALLALTGCSDSAAVPERDAGTSFDEDNCGELGDACCERGDRCRRNGLACEGETCCAEANGASCQSDDDCCSDLECDRGRGSCCSKGGKRCESSSECCDGYVCDEIEEECRPEDPPDCGREGGPCDCYSDRCQEGLSCADNVCEPCGGIDEPCCLSDDQDGGCLSTLHCEDELCRDCGELEEPCCADDDCDGSLTCEVDLICRGDPDLCDYDDCAECAADSSCGFCNDGSGECRALREDCPADEWVTQVTECPATGDCDTRDCGACLRDEGCGFCAETQSCAPVRGSCTEWVTREASCPLEPECDRHTTCDACTGEDGCGFCKDTGDCLYGGSAGPFRGVCPRDDWAFIADRCE